MKFKLHKVPPPIHTSLETRMRTAKYLCNMLYAHNKEKSESDDAIISVNIGLANNRNRLCATVCGENNIAQWVNKYGHSI